MIIDPYSDGTARADLCKEIQIVMNEIRKRLEAVPLAAEGSKNIE